MTVLTEHVGHVAYESNVLNGLESLAIATIGRATLRAAEAIVINNDRVESEVRRLVPDRRIDFLPNGVDTRRFFGHRVTTSEPTCGVSWAGPTASHGFSSWDGRFPRRASTSLSGLLSLRTEASISSWSARRSCRGLSGRGVQLLGPQPHERLGIYLTQLRTLCFSPLEARGFR